MMVKAKKIIVPHRRRREQKTNYKTRLSLLKSNKNRLVVRKSLNNFACQIIKYETGGDKCLVSADSRELKKFGWKGNSGNIPAAYLTGLLCGVKSKKAKISEAVLDIGLYRSTPANRVFAALKGAVDSGMSIPHSKDVMPSDDRSRGLHVASYAEWMKKDSSSEYSKRFSTYLKARINPEDLPKHFDEVKDSILKS